MPNSNSEKTIAKTVSRIRAPRGGLQFDVRMGESYMDAGIIGRSNMRCVVRCCACYASVVWAPICNGLVQILVQVNVPMSACTIYYSPDYTERIGVRR